MECPHFIQGLFICLQIIVASEPSGNVIHEICSWRPTSRHAPRVPQSKDSMGLACELPGAVFSEKKHVPFEQTPTGGLQATARLYAKLAEGPWRALMGRTPRQVGPTYDLLDPKIPYVAHILSTSGWLYIFAVPRIERDLCICQRRPQSSSKSGSESRASSF